MNANRSLRDRRQRGVGRQRRDLRTRSSDDGACRCHRAARDARSEVNVADAGEAAERGARAEGRAALARARDVPRRAIGGKDSCVRAYGEALAGAQSRAVDVEPRRMHDVEDDVGSGGRKGLRGGDPCDPLCPMFGKRRRIARARRDVNQRDEQNRECRRRRQPRHGSPPDGESRPPMRARSSAALKARVRPVIRSGNMFRTWKTIKGGLLVWMWASLRCRSRRRGRRGASFPAGERRPSARDLLFREEDVVLGASLVAVRVGELYGRGGVDPDRGRVDRVRGPFVLAARVAVVLLQVLELRARQGAQRTSNSPRAVPRRRRRGSTVFAASGVSSIKLKTLFSKKRISLRDAVRLRRFPSPYSRRRPACTRPSPRRGP